MPRLILRVAAFMIAACLAVYAQNQPPAADEAALRAVVEKYLAAITQKDLAALVRLWSERSPDLASRIEQLQQQFNREDVTLLNISITGVRIEKDKAILKAAAEATVAREQTKQARQEPFARHFALVKEADGWRVWRDVPATEDLAAFLRVDGESKFSRDPMVFEKFANALISAESDEARNRLLADNPLMLAPELRGALLRIGGQHQAAGLYSRVVPVFHTVRLVAEKMNDRQGLAIAEAGLGNAYRRLGRTPEALSYFERALAAYRALKNDLQIGAMLDEIGTIQLSQNDYAGALITYEQMLNLFEAMKNQGGQANALENIGSTHYEQGRYTEALAFYERALKLRERLGRRAEIAATLNNIGTVHYREENYAAAIEYYQRALPEFEAHDDRQALAGTMNNVGSSHYQQGNYDTALEFYQKSLKTAQSLGDRELQATAMLGAGLVHYAQGNAAQALEHLQKNLALVEALGKKWLMAETLHDIGLVYERQQNHAAALANYQRSLPLYEEAGSRADLPVMWNLIGGVHFAENRFDPALASYQRALAGFNELQDGEMAANATASIAAVHLAAGNTQLSLEQYRRALAMYEATGEREGMAAVLERIANVYFQQGDYPRSLELADRAAEMARQVESDDVLWRSQALAGAIYRATNQLAKAEQSFTDAIAAVVRLRERLVFGERARLSFYRDKQFPFIALMDLLLVQNRTSEAFAIAERVKANTLADAVQGSGVKVTKSLTAVEIAQERWLENQIISLKAQAAREHQRRLPDEKRLATLRAQLEKARSDYKAFETRLHAAHPQLRTLRGDGAPLKLEEAAALLTDADTALLEFIVAPSRTYLFTLTREQGSGVRGWGPEKKDEGGRQKDESTTQGALHPSSFILHPSSPAPGPRPPAPMLTVYAIDARREVLAERVGRFRDSLERRDEGIATDARALFDSLLRPASAQINDKRTLVIIPDGALWQLPFQALQPADNRFLIEDSAIAYAASLPAAKAATRRARPIIRAAMLLAFANPTIDRQSAERARLANKDENIGALAEAESATRQIATLYGASRSRTYTGAQASEQVVKAEAASFRTLHFAAPTAFNDASPMYSHVLLAATAEKDDGLLEAWELLRLNLSADILVLAASETPHGATASGGGLMAFAQGVMVAGCPSLLASHWRADSRGATQLLTEFHRQLLRGNFKAKAEALRQAALKLIQGNEHKHPFEWAGFSLIGDYR